MEHHWERSIIRAAILKPSFSPIGRGERERDRERDREARGEEGREGVWGNHHRYLCLTRYYGRFQVRSSVFPGRKSSALDFSIIYCRVACFTLEIILVYHAPRRKIATESDSSSIFPSPSPPLSLCLSVYLSVCLSV